MTVLLATWHGYAFALVILAGIWALAALFAYTTFLLVAYYNHVTYDADKRPKVLVWPDDTDAALYRDFRSEDDLKTRH